MRWVKLSTGVYVSSDYYSIDGIRFPLDLPSALEVVKGYGARLPTKEEVDLIWEEATVKLAPIPMRAGPAMSSIRYIEEHNALINKQLEKFSSPILIAGHKKDLITPQKSGRVTIYGWHRLNGYPIQPVSSVHSATYYDYSHGVRMVKE